MQELGCLVPLSIFILFLTSLDFSRLTLVKIPVLLYSVPVESLQSSQKIIQLLLTGAFNVCGKREQIYSINIVRSKIYNYINIHYTQYSIERPLVSLSGVAGSLIASPLKIRMAVQQAAAASIISSSCASERGYSLNTSEI